LASNRAVLFKRGAPQKLLECMSAKGCVGFTTKSVDVVAKSIYRDAYQIE